METQQLILEMIKSNREESNRRHDRLEAKMDDLLAFRWKTVGGSLAISAVLAFAFNVFHTFIK